MFLNAIILYGSSFWETAATQNCGHTQGISLTSLADTADLHLAPAVAAWIFQQLS